MAHITQWVPSRAAVLSLAPIQVQQFFTRNQAVTELACIEQAARVLGCQIDGIRRTDVQGADSFTLARVDGPTDTPAIVQFRDLSSPLDISTINLACQTYRGVVPTCEKVDCAFDDQVHTYRMTLVAGIAFCAAQKKLYRDASGQRLTQTVTDFASFVLLHLTLVWLQANQKHYSFVVSSLLRTQQCTDSDMLNQAYGKLAVWEETLPQFRSKLAEIREQLPVIFGPEFPHVLNHADLWDMNIHVDEESGAITGIIDWEGAEIGPFGGSLGSLEVFLGICSGNGQWMWHPQENRLRTVFYETLGQNHQVRQVNADAVEAARAFSLFTTFGSRAGEDSEAASSAAACLGAYLAERTAVQPFLR